LFLEFVFVILPQDFGLRSYAVWPIPLKLTLKLNKSQYTTCGSNRFPYNLKNSLHAAVEGTKVSLVMECMLGDLRTMINTRMHTFKDGQTPYSYPSALFMMFIAKGVKDLHANGILQKNLKASNILVGIRVEMSNWVPEGQAELLDLLDINRVKIGDYENTEDIVGSAFWKVPEVLQVLKEGATPVMKEEADAYSFSMLCYEILTRLIHF